MTAHTMTRDRLVARVARLLHHQASAPSHDEQTAALRLGYAPRVDHPWHRPANARSIVPDLGGRRR